MIDREDLKQFTRKELEDIILSKVGKGIFGWQIEHLIKAKYDEKHQAFETKRETLKRHREEWLEELKQKYDAQTDKELLSQMSIEEKLKCIAKMAEINQLYDEESKLFDEEYKRFERKQGKRK